MNNIKYLFIAIFLSLSFVACCFLVFIFSDLNVYERVHFNNLGSGCIANYLKRNWMNSNEFIGKELSDILKSDDGNCFQTCDDSICKYRGFIKHEIVSRDVNPDLYGKNKEHHFSIVFYKESGKVDVDSWYE
ncbi:MAG: hypothetical protein Q4A28_08465 [Brachymonas sp.]|nr:hypothetical protein [Brachymonas sp.]